MSTKTNSRKEHTEIIELLPLYVNNAIDAADKDKVDAHLETCGDCRKQLEFEKKLQQATSANMDVTQTAQRNLAKFNDMLDEEQSRVGQELGSSKSTTPNMRSSADDKPGIVQRIITFFGDLVPVSGGQFGGAMAMGLCAVLAVGVLYKSSDGASPVGYQDPSNIVRGCEVTDEVQQYEFAISPTSQAPVNVEAIEMLIEGAFSGGNYKLVDNKGSLLLTIDGTVCDKRIPKVTRSLEEQESIGKVLVRTLP